MRKKIAILVTFTIFMAVIAAGCNASNSVEKNYLGNWQDISNSERYAKIYADDKGGYIWEDNEDKYPAKFENKVLKIEADKNLFATATYDESTKNLKVKLEDENFEFKKKEN